MDISEFYIAIKQTGGIVPIEKQNFLPAIKISRDTYSANGLIFRNCVFEEDVFIEDVDLIFGIKFKTCTFKKRIIIHHVIISQLDQEFNFDNESFLLQDCTIAGKVNFHTSNNFLRDLKLENSIVGSLCITQLKSSEGGITIINSTLQGLFDLSHSNLLNNISVSKTTIKGKVRFGNNSASGYSFIDNDFEKDAWIWSGKVTGGIVFNNGVYKGDFHIESVNAKGTLTLIGSKFESDVIVQYETKNEDKVLSFGCPKVFIKDAEFNNGISIVGSIDFLSPYRIEEVQVVASKKLKGEISFSRLEIMELNLSGNNYDANIIFDNNQFRKIIFERFTNFGTLQLIEARGSFAPNSNPEFLCNNSYLGRMHLTNVSFERFHKVGIENSNLSGVVASNVKWFGINQLDVPSDIAHIKLVKKTALGVKHLLCNVEKLNAAASHFRRKRELFRQLKFSMQQQGNIVQALVFRQYEMTFFTKELRLTKTIFNRDRLIMELSCTNSHGQNWVKPMLLLLLSSFIFGFVLFIFAHPYLTFVPSFSYADVKYTLSEFWLHKKIIVQILSPGHLFGSFAQIDTNSSGWLFATDILYRIVYAFFVFQIVTAFRKYIK